MSTRANIIITDGNDHVILYRHSDGYPEGVKETFLAFIEAVRNGTFRDNTMQAAGWLIVLGAMEYGTLKDKLGNPEFMNWKCGAYEPTNQVHGDINYLYLIDLEKKVIKQFSDYAVWKDANIETVNGYQLSSKFVMNLRKKGKTILSQKFLEAKREDKVYVAEVKETKLLNS